MRLLAIVVATRDFQILDSVTNRTSIPVDFNPLVAAQDKSGTSEYQARLASLAMRPVRVFRPKLKAREDTFCYPVKDLSLCIRLPEASTALH
jgi:hypothetical protein